MDGKPNPSLGAIAAAVTLVISLVGLFVLTGVVGRVQRNEGGLLVAALVAVVGAALLYVIAEQIGSADSAAAAPDAPAGSASAAPPAGTRTTGQRIGGGLRVAASIVGTVGICLAIFAS